MNSLSGPAGRNPRSAITLIEVIGTMSVLLVLGIAAAGVLSSITEIGARNSRAQASRLAIERLAGVLRQDVHGASKVDVTAEQIDLTVGDQSIRYRHDPQQQCMIRAAGNDDARGPRDRFALPLGCKPEFASGDGTILLTLRKDSADNHPWVIEARQ